MKQLFTLTFLCLSLSLPVQAGVPAFVTYSGRLTDGTGWGESSEATLVFNLYDAADAVEPFWTTTHPDVAVIDGYFTVNLGMCNDDGSVCSVNPAEAVFPKDMPDQMWVGIEVGGDELVRQPVGSIPHGILFGGGLQPRNRVGPEAVSDRPTEPQALLRGHNGEPGMGRRLPSA